MRLGIGSYTYGWAVGREGQRPARALTGLDLIDRARSLGVGLVQLCDNLPAPTFEPASLAALRDHADAADVALQVGTSGSKPDHLRRLVEAARGLGSDILRLVIDAPGDEPGPDEVVHRVSAVLDDLEAADVTLAIENHDRFRSRDLAAIVRRLDHPRVGVCLDTVNSFGALEGPEVVVENLGPLTVNLHLKDFDVVRVPSLQGFAIEGRPLGLGRLDVPGLLARLGAFGRDPDAIIEHWVPPEPDEDRTIAKEREWAEQSVAAARRWIDDSTYSGSRSDGIRSGPARSASEREEDPRSRFGLVSGRAPSERKPP